MPRHKGIRVVSVMTAFMLSLIGVAESQISPALANSASISVDDFTAINGQARSFTISLENFQDGDYLVVIAADSGQLNLSQTTGLTATGNYKLTGDSELGFSGTLADIEAALTGMTYTGTSNGSVNLSVNVSEQGVPTGGTIPAGELYFNPGNGHYYEFVDNGSAITWTDALGEGSQRSLLGLTGYLATVTSNEENSFVADKMDTSNIWIGATDAVSVVNGVTEPDAGQEGHWFWVSGPEAGTQFWTASDPEKQWEGENSGGVVGTGQRVEGRFESWAQGEPNNADGTSKGLGTEHYAVTNWAETTGMWNDLLNSPHSFSSSLAVSGFIVEYGGIGTSTAIKADTSATITVQASASAPGAPNLVSVMGGGEAGTNELLVSFTAGSDGGAAISNYEYAIKKSSVSWPDPLVWTTPDPEITSSPITISGLEEDTKYDVQIRAVNSQGGGTASSVLSGFTAGSSNDLTNGNFENNLAGWNPVDPANGSFIDLASGTSDSPVWEDASNKLVVEQCDIFDVQDYTAVADRRQGSQGGKAQTDPWPRHDGNPPNSSSFDVKTVTALRSGRGPASPAVIGSKSLELYSSVSTLSGWDVVHGPAIYSDGFSASAGDVITLDWYASYVSDDFAIQGILLDTSDCSQELVLSATGSSVADMTLTDADGNTTTVSSGSGWQRAALTIDQARTDNALRFVFVSGTFDRSGGLAAGAALYVDNISAGQPQTITFPAQENRGLGETPTLSATASSGLPVAWSSSDESVCTISSAGVVTMVSGGTCSITASQDGGRVGDTLFAAAPSVTEEFTVEDTRLSALAGSTDTLSAAFAEEANASAYTVNVPTTTTSYSITPTAQSGSAEIEVNDVVVSSGSASDPVNLVIGANDITLKVTVGSTSTITTITVIRAAPPAPERRTREVVAPPVIPPPAERFRIPVPATNFVNDAPPPVSGPVVRGTVISPPDNPFATVNGVPQVVQTSPVGNTGVRVTTGRVNVGINIQGDDTGRVVQNTPGTPELSVIRGGATRLSGSGLLPGSTVQAFLTFGQNESSQLAQVPVAADGTFDAEAALRPPGSNRPIPIGRQVLQVVTVDDEGNQTVVDMPINVAQPPPQPEAFLDSGEIPTVPVGQTVATRAGEPVNVSVIPIPDNKQTVIEGGDWTMEITAQGEGSAVQETPDGGAVIEFTRDQSAQISGSGFMPLTRADVWLFSEPTLLGSVDIDENGEFNGTVNVDGRVVTVGEHTLQLQGVGEDGYTRSANLGVVVNDAEGTTATTEAMSLGWLWWLLAIVALVAAAGTALWWRLRRARG